MNIVLDTSLIVALGCHDPRQEKYEKPKNDEENEAEALTPSHCRAYLAQLIIEAHRAGDPVEIWINRNTMIELSDMLHRIKGSTRERTRKSIRMLESIQNIMKTSASILMTFPSRQWEYQFWEAFRCLGKKYPEVCEEILHKEKYMTWWKDPRAFPGTVQKLMEIWSSGEKFELFLTTDPDFSYLESACLVEGLIPAGGVFPKIFGSSIIALCCLEFMSYSTSDIMIHWDGENTSLPELFKDWEKAYGVKLN